MDRTLKPGMKLLVEAGEGQRCLQVDRASVFDPFSSSRNNVYKNAADTLVFAELERDARYCDDGMIFPILFNYRDAVELALKDLIRFGHQLGYDDAELKVIFGKDYQSGKFGGGVLGRHGLMPLWEVVGRMFSKHDWHPEQVVVAGELVKELHEADPDSHTMRYDRDKSELHENVGRFNKLSERIDIDSLRHTVDCLFAYFERLTMWIEGELTYGSLAKC